MHGRARRRRDRWACPASSAWGVEALITGAFDPPGLVGRAPFADLEAMVAHAEARLSAFTPDAINACAGELLDLQIGPRRLAFTAETFILSFSLPNFHFHAVTAYDILHPPACTRRGSCSRRTRSRGA